ncbi:MAG: ABC transporter permease [Deltaproteobacteria bacterium]|jgi:peptide/nickel transport system permease protein
MKTNRRTGRPALAVGLATLALMVAFSLAAPWISPFDPSAQNLSQDLAAPSAQHWLGQDKLGRDQLSRIIYGARVSLQVGLGSVALSLLLGITAGVGAGLGGRVADSVIMRLVDVLLAFPGILLAIAMAAVLGPSLTNVIVALGLIGWTGYARLVRAEVLAIKALDHVEAASALGAGRWRLVVRHILPLLAAPLSVQATFGMASAIVAEASLSFLGLGVQPPTPSWGSMINEGRSFMLMAPHMTLYPGLAVLMAVLGLNALGDGLRERLDVRSR